MTAETKERLASLVMSFVSRYSLLTTSPAERAEGEVTREGSDSEW